MEVRYFFESKNIQVDYLEFRDRVSQHFQALLISINFDQNVKANILASFRNANHHMNCHQLQGCQFGEILN